MKKKFIVKLTVLLLPFVCLSVFTQVYIDAFSIYHPGIVRETKFTNNQRFVKMKHILDSDGEYKSLIFASSRGAFLDPNLLCDKKGYNMGYSSGTLKEYYENLQTLSGTKSMPEEVFITFDMASILSPPDVFRTGFLINYPVDRNLFAFYAKNIMQQSVINTLETYFSEKSQEFTQRTILVTPVIVNHLTDGRYCAKDYIKEEIERDPEAQINHRFFKLNPQSSWAKPNDGIRENADGNLSYLQKILSLCEKQNVKIRILSVPNTAKMFLERAYEVYFDFLKELAKITQYDNFSGINQISTNNLNFYESSHPTEETATLVADIIKRPDSVPNLSSLQAEGFGVTVDSGNVDEIVDILSSNCRKYIQELTPDHFINPEE